MTFVLPKRTADSPLHRAAEALPLALALAKVAKRKRSTGREHLLAKQHVAPKDKRGRWADQLHDRRARDKKS